MNEITLESIAKHCIDDNITSDQMAYLLRAQAELERLRRIETATCTVNGQRWSPAQASAILRSWVATLRQEKGYESIEYMWIDAIADALEAE